MKRNWVILPKVPDSIVVELGLPQLQCQLLFNRGLTTRAAVQSFLSPNSSDSHDPWLMPDMKAAVQRLMLAFDQGELIGVFGDFDIDGISGTAVMTTVLRDLGANVIAYIPDRESEGHGLGLQAVQSMARRGVSLLVTVDCGSTSESAIAEASSLGVDTIVTDHHVVLNAPPYPVVAMVNPKRPDSEYPFQHLTGAGMAYKLAQALYDSAGRTELPELLELTALGTIGDVGDLVGENRYLVSEGIRRMNTSRSTGLNALAEVSGLGGRDFDASTLSFQIIPRLNAPGRLADPGISLDLLTTSDTAQARSMASQIDHLNSLRKTATESGVKQAEAQILRRWGDSPPSIIMVGRRDWSHGIVGLIASRLAEAHNRPSIALAVGERESRASARSVSQFNLMEVIEPASHLMTQFGGHAQAAGFTIPNENLVELAALLESVPDLRPPLEREARTEIDLHIDPSLVKRELFEFTERLAPFGKANPRPKFMSTSVRVLDSRRVGTGEHLKLRISDGVETWDAIGFRQGDRVSDATVGSDIDVIYQMERNTWNGRTRLQLVIDDLARSQKPTLT